MTDTTNQKYDLAIIGTGYGGNGSGRVCGQSRTFQPLLWDRWRESWFTGGLIDLMGVHPIESGKTWQDPWAAIEAVAKDIPGHPYGRLTRKILMPRCRNFIPF